MPVCAEKRKNKWRVVECGDRTIVKNKAGTAVDGGGGTEQAIKKQVRAINASLSRQGKI